MGGSEDHYSITKNVFMICKKYKKIWNIFKYLGQRTTDCQGLIIIFHYFVNQLDLSGLEYQIY